MKSSERIEKKTKKSKGHGAYPPNDGGDVVPAIPGLIFRCAAESVAAAEATSNNQPIRNRPRMHLQRTCAW